MSLEILDSGGDYAIAVYSSGTPKISLIHFGSSLLNNPTNSDVIRPAAQLAWLASAGYQYGSSMAIGLDWSIL